MGKLSSVFLFFASCSTAHYTIFIYMYIHTHMYVMVSSQAICFYSSPPNITLIHLPFPFPPPVSQEKNKQTDKQKNPLASVYYAFHHAAQMREQTRTRRKKASSPRPNNSPPKNLGWDEAESNQARYIKCIDMLLHSLPMYFQAKKKKSAREKTPSSLI
ncbi:hypothetical protein PSV08DRAFT_341198, partial [Bipolaris maydis]|uniref:uncharacterized protein n=1 Tax=Cochliobolus heterostrophus TaxID=5016 RepID=UPI0024D09278